MEGATGTVNMGRRITGPTRVVVPPKDLPSTKVVGKKIDKWAVGVTIAAREEQTYNITIDSFLSAGWDSIHLFCEPDVIVTENSSHFPRTYRKEKQGAWSNWFNSLNDLIDTYPDADCYGLIQDDVVFCKGLRKFMEDTLWPSEDTGVCSVFVPSHYTRNMPGWYKTNRGFKLWMAQTFFFTPEAARSCVNYEFCKKWDKEKQIDNVVGRWANETKQYPYYFSPSLAQHVGNTSTIWSKGNRAAGKRAASDFVGEEYDLGIRHAGI
tara:strand:+ start:71 stop:868 length:798 start_codon:yes stop_codon:yes gene_type:complete